MAQGEELRQKIKETMVEELMLDFDASEIADETPIFGAGGLGLDSVDALQPPAAASAGRAAAGKLCAGPGRGAAAARLGRVLWNDPGTGVMRHADAGYEIAKNCAKEQGLDLPMQD